MIITNPRCTYNELFIAELGLQNTSHPKPRKSVRTGYTLLDQIKSLVSHRGFISAYQATNRHWTPRVKATIENA